MRLLTRHPPRDILLAFDDGELSAAARQRVADHLTGCPRCRGTVADRRVARTVLRAGTASPISSTLRSAVLGRVAAGERRVLPSGTLDTGPASTVTPVADKGTAIRRGLIAATLCVALAWGVANVARPLEAGASSGTLTVLQRVTPSGRRLDVHYRAAATLASADSVRVVAIAFPAGDQPTPRSLTVSLRRQRDGTFDGQLLLPEDVVRLTMRVVHGVAGVTDDNDGRGWEVLAEDRQGTPLFAALRQQHLAHAMTDWERAHQAALAMLRHYPNDPTSVRWALGGELELAGPARADSVRRVFRPRFDTLDRALSARAVLDEDTFFEMISLAGAVGDTTAQRAWRARLFREAPRSATAVQQRVFIILEDARVDAAKLVELERLYRDVGDAAPQLGYEGFRLAVAAGDPHAILTWGERFRARAPYAALDVVQAYARVPSLRTRGLGILREQLAASPPATSTDWTTTLGTATPPAHQRTQGLLTALGRTLLSDGSPSALAGALDTLRRAAALGRSATTLRWLGQAALATGDTSTGATAVAWTVADPRLSDTARDSLTRSLGAAGTSPRFLRERELADSVYRSSILAGAVREVLPSGPQYRTLAGESRAVVRRPAGGRAPVAPDAGGTPTRDPRPTVALIAFVSRGCAPSLADLAALERVRRRWQAQGVHVLALVAERPDSTAVRALATRGFAGEVGFDDRALVARAMRQVGTPQYVVLEEGTVVRFRTRSAADAGAFLDALLGFARDR